MNTDSADFADILAQGEASVKSDKSVFIFLNTDSADFTDILTGSRRSIRIIRIIRIRFLNTDSADFTERLAQGEASE